MADREYHDDGSYTERFSDGTTATYYPDGEVKEYTRHETVHPLGAGDKVTVTHDKYGNPINTQEGWGKKA